MTDPIALTWIAEGFSQIASQLTAFVKGSQWQKSGIAGDLAAGKISVNGSMSVEEKTSCGYGLSLLDAPKGRCWVHENPVFINF